MAGIPDNDERALIQAQNDQALAAILEAREEVHNAATWADQAVLKMVELGGVMVSRDQAIVSVLSTIHIHLLNEAELARRAAAG